MTRMPDSTRQAGLVVLRGVLRRRNPGFDVIFEFERTDFIDDPTTGKVGRRLTAPEDASAVGDRIAIATTAAGTANEDAVDEAAENLPLVVDGEE